jgi:signal transduction histidine kinase
VRAAAAAQREKETTLGLLAHEIRQPIQVVNTCLAILEHPPDPQTSDDALKRARRSLAQMIRLVDDVLVAACAEHGPLSIVAERLDLGQLLQESIAEIADAAQRNGIAVRRELLDGGTDVYADPVRVRQVVRNLLSNALKFTPAGGTITVRVAPAGQLMRLTVIDTGEGIPPERLDTLFRRFSQTERRLDHHGFRGLGLGLWIVREIVHAHGGEVEVESEGLGRGSRFIVTLPRGQQVTTGDDVRAAG